MPNMPLHPKYAKTSTIKLYIIMKQIYISVSMISCVAKTKYANA